MLIKFSEVLKLNIPIKGVIHVGAHYGQEYNDYVHAGIDNMMFFEPVRSTFEILKTKIPETESVKLFNVALGNETGEIIMFKETRNAGMSNSCLEPGTHLAHYPKIQFTDKEIVGIDKLDNIDFDSSLFNFINMDVQGFELEVLKGAARTLNYIDIVYTEINTEEVYKDCCLVEELDYYLKLYGFDRVLTASTGKGWGDALYLKR